MTEFRVWAPVAEQVAVVLDEAEHQLSRAGGGWWSAELTDATPGSDYGLRLDGSPDVLPDPRSRWQPDGVHGRSRVYDGAAFGWTDGTWRGLHLPGAVLYELHVGTFTPGGTFDSALERLDHLVALGVDAVELLPVAAFNGDRGWGYDGVDLYAVHAAYGGPDGLKRFVDGCHARGLGVVLDVVYNHLGPSGNYLSSFGPYFTEHHQTPWGAAVNLDDEGSDDVRAFLVDNAVMWLRDFHVDGLRLDAVHALVDDSAVHLLEELATRVEELAAQVRRPLFLVGESDLNDIRLVRTREAGGLGLSGQWCDDVHHAVHSTVTGETQGYYGDFGSLATLAKALTGAFVHDGAWSSFRGRRHGRPVDRLLTPGSRFVSYLQDHDQIGNRATGDRISATVPIGRVLVGATLVLTAPFVPMLFMGEEWAASTPWQYFTSHPEPELAEAVRNGRRAEFASHGWAAADVPDPQAESTFRDSVLPWHELDDDDHAAVLTVYRRLIALRRATPELTDGRLDRCHATWSEQDRWFVLRRGAVAVVCNLADSRREVPVDGTPVESLLATHAGFAYRAGFVDLEGDSACVVRLLPPAPPD